MKVSELSGAMLDYWVARAEGWAFGPQHKTLECDVWRDADGCIVGVIPAQGFRPSMDWESGGPIIERERIDTAFGNEPGLWEALVRPEYEYGMYMCDDGRGTGPTILIAAMRAYCASKFGDTVPDEPQPVA